MPEAFSIKDALSSGESLKLMVILMTGKDVDFTTEALPDGKGVELQFEDEKSLKTVQEFFHDLIHGDLLKGFVDKMADMFEGLGGPSTTDS
jgi:hypothetical protein